MKSRIRHGDRDGIATQRRTGRSRCALVRCSGDRCRIRVWHPQVEAPQFASHLADDAVSGRSAGPVGRDGAPQGVVRLTCGALACASCGASSHWEPARLAARNQNPVGGPISVEPRINDRIRVPEVRLVGPGGEQVGIVRIEDALRLAEEADLDLVEVAPMARPPVAKLMDYGKFKYESAVKAREARKNQTQTVIKEMKLRPKIDTHDYETKKGHVVRFLQEGDKVKITIMFRGREQSRPEMGARLLQRLAEDVVDLGFVESAPKLDGRNMIMVLGPHKKKADFKAERAERAEHAEAERVEHAEAERAERADRARTAPAAQAPVEAPPVDALAGTTSAAEAAPEKAPAKKAPAKSAEKAAADKPAAKAAPAKRASSSRTSSPDSAAS